MGTCNELKRAVNARCQVTGRIRSGDVAVKEVGKLHAPSPPPYLGDWQPSSHLRQVMSSASPQPLGAAHGKEPRVCMPARNMVHKLQYAAGMHKSFVGTWKGCYRIEMCLHRPDWSGRSCLASLPHDKISHLKHVINVLSRTMHHISCGT